MFAELMTTENLVAFCTLTSLEIVLGIDNVIFIAILAGKLPEHQRDFARQLGLTVAVVSRILLLLCIGWVIMLKEPLFTLVGQQFTGKDLVLIFGGVFLLAKSTYEIHHKVEGMHSSSAGVKAAASLSTMLMQVVLVDLVFSLDSVITAVGMCKSIPVMVAAILVSVVVMLVFSKAIVTFVERHPAIKVLALSFLLLIGFLLVAEGFHHKVPKGYVYFAMAFSLGVELLQMRAEGNARKAVVPHPSA
jgi:predicted tellurium resistance membrane protein TerC